MPSRVKHFLVSHPFHNSDGTVTQEAAWACGGQRHVGYENDATQDPASVTCQRCRKSHHMTGAVNYRGRY